MDRLRHLLRVQRGEGRAAASVVAMMLVASAGLTIGESGITALFFDRIGADALPLIFIGQGVVGLVGMLLLTAGLGRFDRRRSYVALPLLLAAVVAVERVLAASGARWVYPTMWLTVTAAYLVQAVYLWGTAGHLTDTRRAKRLFPLFGAGGILGSVVGGLATTPLAGAIGAENLLLVWLASLLGTAALCANVLAVRRGDRAARRPRRRAISPLAELRSGFEHVRRTPLLWGMTGAAVLFSVLYYTLYQPYAETANARFPDPDELAGFFGIFWAAVTAAAFLVSILLTNRLLGRFGAAAVVLVLPVMYAGSFGLLFATSTFAVLVALRFGVCVWLQGVSSPAWETLVNVIPETRRDQTRAFLNGGPSQIGTALAGMIQLFGRRALSSTQLTAIGLAAALATIATVWLVRRSYARALLDALRAGRPSVFDAVPGTVVALRSDAQTTGLAIEASSDREPRIRRLAVAMLDPADDRAASALRRATEDEDAMVRRLAVGALGRTGGGLETAQLDRALADPDPEVRLAALESGVSAPPSLLGDPDPAVRIAAAAGLLDGPSGVRALETFGGALADPDPEVRRIALEWIARAGVRDLVPGVVTSLDDEVPGVRAAGLGALAATEPSLAIPAALDALTAADPVVRSAALDALSHVEDDGLSAAIVHSARERSTLAEGDLADARSLGTDGPPVALLREALLARGRARGLAAMSALSVLQHDPATLGTALAILEARDAGQLPNALETLEVTLGPQVRPLLPLWEAADEPIHTTDPPLDRLAGDDDALIRACVEFIRSRTGGPVMSPTMSLSEIERVLILRDIPLFEALSPGDLGRIAAIAEERTYVTGDVIAGEGEGGDELHLIVAGSVRVIRGADGVEIARRGSGDVIGEMSIITRSPRMASLIAEGDVRTLRIGHREFEAMIRERPEVALGVMRVLAERLTAEPTTSPRPA